ncbi:MAG: DUF6701 domain-containing protein, partial [Psychrobium sp.]
MQRSLSTFTNKLWRMLGLLCFSLVFSSSAYAVQCLDIFSQSHRINGPSFNSFSFPNNNSNNDISESSFSTTNIAAGNYRDIFVRGSSLVTFTTVGGTYNIRDLTVYANSTIRFSPGDYYIDSFHFGFRNTLEVIGNGTVRIFVRNRMRSFQDNEWNIGGSGHLMVYAGNLNLARNNSASFTDNITFNGAIYTDNLTLSNPSATIVKGSGSLASRNNRSISSNQLTYSTSVISAIDFGALCDFATIQSQWNLDESAWSGNGSVLDSLGTNHGTPFGGLAPSSVNPVTSTNPGTCNFGDFDGQNDYFEVDNNLGDDFTLMAWVRPTENFRNGSFPYQGDGLFWSDVSSGIGDFLVAGLRRSGQNRISFMVGGTGSDIVLHSGPIPLNTWTHVAVTRNRSTGDMAIYFNGVLNASRTSNNTLPLTANPKIGIGGNPLDNRYFEGGIDEVRVYSGVASTAQMTQAMNETRPCPTAGPTVEYRFDNFHTFAPDAVLDSSGNDNHGTAFTASNAQGLLCTAADFSAAGDANYIVANSAALNGLSDFTAMAWIKTTQTHDSTIFSAASSNSGAGTNEAVFYFDDANRFWPTITDSPFDTSTRLSSSSNINDGQWHQVVWTREAATRESCFYVDGVLQGCVDHPDSNDSNPISVAANALVIGQEQDSLGGDFEIEQSFDGLMDEFMIFDYVMPAANIAIVNDNIRSNKNWDGTPRAACPVAFPTVDMRFDETSWSGNGSVLDSSGNNFHGTPFGAAAPISGMSCNALNLRQTGINDYVSLSNQAVNGMQDFSIVFWGKVEANHNMAAVSGASTTQNNELLMFFQPQSSSIRPFVKGQNSAFSTSFDDAWHQYAWTREASTGRVCLYRDGTLLGSCSTSFSSSPLAVSPNGFVIGQEQDSVGGNFAANQAWDGLIDELLIFPTVLTQAQIQEYRQNILDGNDWRGLPKACNDTVDHYRFEFSNNGLTCAASNITLRACEDSSCSNEATINTSLDLSPANQWTGNDVAGSSTNFNGSTGLFLSQNTLGTIAIGASNLNPAPSSATPVQCYNGSTAINCEIAFKDTGFLFNQIPTQISGKPSNTEFNKKALTIKAVAKNSVTGVCENVFANNTDVILQLKTNCHADIGNCSNAFITKEGGTSAEQINGTYSDVTLRFGADSTAQYSYEYFNAGEMSLSARKVVTLPSGDNAVLEDSSNSFVIKPFGFKFVFPEDSDPYDDGNPSGDFSKFKQAGQAFKITAVPIMWQSGEDGDPDVPSTHDGNIDANKNADNNVAVANFSGESVKLARQLVLPTVAQGGNEGSFTATNTALFDSVASFVDARWNEVGVINITADLVDGNYRGGGNVVGYANNVGRFYPDHFTVSNIVAGDLTGQCINQTFVGELIADGADSGSELDGALRYYSTNPAMRINAMAAGATTPLNNYRGDFMRLQNTSVTVSPAISPNGLTVNAYKVNRDVETGTINESAGVVTFTMSDNDNFAFDRNNAAKVAPFSATLNFPVAQVEDQDEVVLKTGLSVTLSASSNGDHEVVYGRIKLHNAFGPDNQALAMPVEHQMYNGSEFVTNTVIGAGCSYPVTPSSDFTLGTSPFGDI